MEGLLSPLGPSQSIVGEKTRALKRMCDRCADRQGAASLPPAQGGQRSVAPGPMEEALRIFDSAPVAARPEPREDPLGGILRLVVRVKHAVGGIANDAPPTLVERREALRIVHASERIRGRSACQAMATMLRSLRWRTTSTSSVCSSATTRVAALAPLGAGAKSAPRASTRGGLRPPRTSRPGR